MAKRHTYEFIKKQFEKEGYELLSKEYINANNNLDVRCPNGHEYSVRYNNFKNKYRCPYCFGNKKLTYEFVKEQIEKEGYKLISKKYVNSNAKIKIRCTNGHEYPVIYNSFRLGNRCPFCSGVANNSYEFVKEQIEKEGYKLLSEKYKNSKTKLKIKCDKGHEYPVTYNDFRQGCRCPYCKPNSSKAEKEIAEYIKSLNVDIIENDRNIIKPLELDIVTPFHKLAIEYCGLYWHSEENKDENYHKNKLEKTNEAGYRLITIFEDEWIYKKDIVKNRLKYFLGLNNKRIYARKCTIREVEAKQAKDFINKYHIQGYSNSKVKLGSFYKDELVAVMTFSNASRRGNKEKNTWELNRFCTSCNVVGIASKFIKYFQRNYEWKKITTFADLRWSEGSLYEKIGFTKCYNVNLNYFYIRKNGKKRIHRFNFRKSVLKDKIEDFNPQLTEHQNMLNNGWLRIYDCGNIKYEIIGDRLT